MLTRLAMTAAAALVAAGTGWGQWTAVEEAKLTASDAAAGDEFGLSVSISGDTAVVGSYWDSHAAGTNAGSAYVFVRSGASWTEQAKLTASDAAADDRFGYSVSISGDTVVVGAYVDDHAGGNAAGSAYVFVRSGTTWTEQAKLTASDAVAGDEFGYSVSISGDTAVVGAPWDNNMSGYIPGSAYVFVRSGLNWSEQAKLTASDVSMHLGRSVSISGDTVVVGAPGDGSSGFIPGTAYVFVRAGTSWVQQAKLTKSFSSIASYGHSVSISGDTAVVGAPSEDNAGGIAAGSALVFIRSGTNWTEQDKLTASNTVFFGKSVSVSGETAVVGAPYDTAMGGPGAGSAFLFVRTGTSWTEEAELTASDGADGDEFGTSVALDQNTVAVGAHNADQPGATDTGSAYVYGIYPDRETYCTAGTSASGCQAQLSASGAASATASSGFTLAAATVEGTKDGQFYFGANGRQATPWGNGTSYQCVVPPVKRCGVLSGLGTSGACDGSFSQDLNALWCPTCPKAHKNPGAGAVVQAQLWNRDPLSTSNQKTSLSDAIEFVVGP